MAAAPTANRGKNAEEPAAQLPDPDGRPARRHPVAGRAGGLPAHAAPRWAGRAVAALPQLLYAEPALPAVARLLHDRAAALGYRRLRQRRRGPGGAEIGRAHV